MKIACPHCQGRIAADEQWLGHQADCPHCHLQFIVQAPGSGSLPPLQKVHDGNTADSEVPDEGEPSGQTSRTAWKAMADSVGQVSGLEKLEGFSLAKLFSEVFSKHAPEEIEERLTVGTKATTPNLSDINIAWPTPWVFCRVLLLSLGGATALYWAIMNFENPKLIPGWIFIGCFGIPFATLLFFFESNILRNVSYYRVQTVLILGGILSLLFSLFLFDQSFLDEWIGAMSAGPIEEAGKLLAVIFFTRKWVNDHWTLNGLLFGAAVGTGFSAFESAGFVFLGLSSGEDFGAEGLMILRAFLSPFTHTIWTAATAAALWRIKGKEKFRAGMLVDLRFLRVFALIALLHTLWNSPLTIPMLGDTFGFFALRIIFGIVGWIVIFLLIQAGLEEVRVAQRQSAHLSDSVRPVAENTSSGPEQDEEITKNTPQAFHYLGPNNEPIGPISSDVLLQLRESGAVTDETLVAPEGESEWKPLRQFLEVVEEPQP